MSDVSAQMLLCIVYCRDGPKLTDAGKLREEDEESEKINENKLSLLISAVKQRMRHFFLWKRQAKGNHNIPVNSANKQGKEIIEMP